MQVDGHLKTVGPFHHGRVVVWMGDGDGSETAQLLDSCHRLVVDQAHAVPEHIAMFVLHQQGSLADCKCRNCPNADQVRLMLPELVTKTVFLHLGQRCPLLSPVSYILALIETDRTCLWRLLTRRKLCSTRLTNPFLHL